MVALGRWSSDTIKTVWEFTWVDSALVVLVKWSSYRGGRLYGLDCNRIVDHLKKCGLFYFQYGLRSSWSTADLVANEFDRTARAFNRSGATQAIVFDVSLKVLTGFGMLVFFTNLSLMEFQVRYLVLFCLFSVIDGFGWFWMESIHKNIQLMLESLKAPFLVLHFSLL